MPALGLGLMLAHQSPVITLIVGLIVLAAAAVGVWIERWLFFAEAQHVVTLYYGADIA